MNSLLTIFKQKFLWLAFLCSTHIQLLLFWSLSCSETKNSTVLHLDAFFFWQCGASDMRIALYLNYSGFWDWFLVDFSNSWGLGMISSCVSKSLYHGCNFTFDASGNIVFPQYINIPLFNYRPYVFDRNQKETIKKRNEIHM